MFNLLLALITGLVIGWNFHAFFLQLNPPNILKNEINITQFPQKKILKKEIRKEEIPQKFIAQTKTPKETKVIEEKQTDSFYTLLEKNLFSDAMVLYLDASETKLLLYQSTLLKYFETKIETEPQEAVEQMLEFQELAPSNTKNNIEILHEIEDNNYTEKAKILLDLIKEKMNITKEYIHELPLTKIGEHFTVDVTINDELITLLLDTGATLTMVNENKLSSTLTLIKENIVLNTAGGEINAKLQIADTFSVGKIELEKFQIVSSSFEQKDADGLLGMNFFKKFKFKIDQEKAILYLSEK